MSFYYKIETQQVLSEQEIKAEYPNTSFTVPFKAPEGYEPILETPAPETTTYQTAYKNGVVQDSLGNYVWAWAVSDWDQEAIDAYNEQQKKNNKTQAEKLLQESDWSQYSDVSNPANTPHLTNYDTWMFYRLELRSIAINPPVTIENWPVKPEELWSTTV